MTINVVSAAAFGAFRLATEEKRKKSGLACGACRGKGFYICKVCKGDATIKWSPLYDPVCINPCLCPTCDGHRYQMSDYEQYLIGFSSKKQKKREDGI